MRTAKNTASAPRGWKTYELYGGKVTLGFDEFGARTGRRHSYWLKVPPSATHPEGRKLIPGVTGISGLLTEAASGLSPWAARCAVEQLREAGHKITDEQAFEAVNAHTNKRDLAAVRGTDVHALIEKIVKQDEIADKARASPAYKVALAVTDFLDAQRIQIIACEIRVFSVAHEFSGTTDLVVEFPDGRRCVLDVKTSKAFRAAHAMQIAAYSLALEEEFQDKPKFADAGVVLASMRPKINLLSEAMHMPGQEALARCKNAFLGLLAVRTSIPDIKNFGRT